MYTNLDGRDLNTSDGLGCLPRVESVVNVYIEIRIVDTWSFFFRANKLE